MFGKACLLSSVVNPLIDVSLSNHIGPLGTIIDVTHLKTITFDQINTTDINISTHIDKTYKSLALGTPRRKGDREKRYEIEKQSRKETPNRKKERKERTI